LTTFGSDTVDKPHFKCNNPVTARLHSHYFKLTCIVHSIPDARDFKILTGANDNDTLDDNEANDELNATISSGVRTFLY